MRACWALGDRVDDGDEIAAMMVVRIAGAWQSARSFRSAFWNIVAAGKGPPTMLSPFGQSCEKP